MLCEMPARPVKRKQRKKKPPISSGLFSFSFFCLRLFDDFDNTSRMGVDQNRLIVDHGVAVLPNAIHGWNVVISHAFLGKDCTHP